MTVRLQSESGEQTSSMGKHHFSGGFVFCQMSSLKQLISGLDKLLGIRQYVAMGGNKGCYCYS